MASTGTFFGHKLGNECRTVASWVETVELTGNSGEANDHSSAVGVRIQRRLRYTAGSHIEGPPVASEADVPNCNHCSAEGAIEEVLVERILPSEGQLSMVR